MLLSRFQIPQAGDVMPKKKKLKKKALTAPKDENGKVAKKKFKASEEVR